MMRAALALARRSLGRTWPNPAVGCVIVRDDRVIARGRTRDGGRPHAETDAIAHATESLNGATAYVTLEPCSHTGKAPPCADALIAAGVTRVVSAMADPYPEVDGRGHAKLEAAGIAVEVGEGAREAAEINAGFLLRVREGRPLFHLKIAASLDGHTATALGQSKWITSAEARLHGHSLRATHDAILVGSNTAGADDPDLTCRLPGLERYSPVRIVLDTKARLSPSSRLAQSARATPTWLICTQAAPKAARDLLLAKGVEIIEVEATPQGRVDIAAAARALGARGLTRVVVEGGGTIAAAFLRAGVIDRVSSYRAGLFLGADSRSAVAALGIDGLDVAPRFTLVSSRAIGGDTLETWRKAS